MSSRPTTPTDDNRTVKVPLDTSVSTSTSQGSQTPATGLQGNMLATARYPTYTLYSQPSRHPTYDTRHEAQTATNVSQPLYAPPRSSLQSSSALGAAQPASVALSSEDTQYHGAVPATTEVELPKRTSSRLRRSSATVEESTGQSSTEAGPVVDETAPAPRKKRTRTLTTAHQSSVLLSLLAKTPFPTTAEREHVGRQIGLTARKVQVWFQNQRQKQKKSSQTGNLATPDQAATTSAPLPLARQPGFSALHAARMGVVASPSNPTHLSGSQFSGGTSVGITGYGHSVGPPTGPYREQVTMPYTSVYSRSFAEQTPYYHPQPGATVGNESYLQQSVATSSPPRPRTSHSHITPSPYAPAGSYSETLHTPQTVSAGMTGSSYGHASHPSTSQGTTSDDHSLPPASETGLHYTSSPSEAWRYKPLPPLPTAPSPRDRSLNWEHQSAQHEFRPPPVPPSRSRAFSNPDSRSSEQEPGGHFTHVRGSSSTLPPPSSYGLTRFAPAASVLPVESTAPSSYHGHSEYRAEDVSSVNTGGEGHYNVRYGETHTSPGTASPTSSLSYAEGVALGIGQSQHGRTTYSPIDRRRNRLSYDSSLAARSQLGKRSWSSEDERASKRPRTDDGHITVPLGPSPLSFPSAHGASAHPPISYQPPTSSSASLSSVMSQSTLGIHMPSPSTPAGQPENLNTRYYSSNDP